MVKKLLIFYCFKKFNDILKFDTGDPNSMWTAPGQNLNWVIFDFKADHCISKIRLYAWKSKEMPFECYLQVSNSIE